MRTLLAAVHGHSRMDSVFWPSWLDHKLTTDGGTNRATHNNTMYVSNLTVC